MKIKKWSLVAAAAALVSLFTAQAETVKVFALNAGANKCLANADTVAAVKAMLNDATKDVDFGYFCGPKGTTTTYFNMADDNYEFDVKMVTQAYGGIHVFTYRKDRYDLVKRYDYVATGNGGIDACVVMSKATGAYYILVMPTGSQFNNSSSAKINAYQGPIKNVVGKCREDYPTAKIFIGTTLHWGADYAALQDYLTNSSYLGLLEARVDVDPAVNGGIYYVADPTITSVGVENVSITGAEEPAAIATLTYSSGYSVTFRDWDDSVIDVVKVPAGGDATPPADPVREGYDFMGWNGDFMNVTEDRDVIATYDIKTFDVQFVWIDETTMTTNAISQETVAWGNPAMPPSPPERTGYRFIDWIPADFTSVKQDMLIVAQYEELANIFKVRFLDSDGTTVLKEEEVVGGTAATAPADPTPKKEGDLFYGWIPSDFTCIVSNTDIVAEYGSSTMEVSSADDFATVVAKAPAVATVKLVNNIDFAGVKSYDSPNLIATFDGNGFAVSNLSVNASLFGTVWGEVKNVKLVGFKRAYGAYNTKGAVLAYRLEGARVHDVIVEDCSVSSKNSTCGLATIAYYVSSNAVGVASVVSNCVARNCMLTGTENNTIGGIVGEPFVDSEVVDCQFLTDEKTELSLGGVAVSIVGGIVGQSHGAKIRRCFAEGFFKAGSSAMQQQSGVGGIIGLVTDRTTEVVDCTNTAAVLFCNYNGGAGGIVGRGMKTTLRVTRCWNEGTVDVSSSTNWTSYAGCGAGGIFGGGWGNMYTIIVDSRNEGAVTSLDTRAAGGILGEANGTDQSGTVHCRFTNCVNVASVTSCQRAGGIAGRLYKLEDTFTVVNCGNVGEVSCPTGNVGGVVGVIVGIPQNNDKSFYYKNLYNVMNCGNLVTDTGTVGKFVGVLQSSERNAYVAQLKSVFFADREDTELAGRMTGKEGTEVTVDEVSQIAVAADDFLNRRAMKALNVYAKANDLPLWVQTKTNPDLSLFTEGLRYGLMLIIQ